MPGIAAAVGREAADERRPPEHTPGAEPGDDRIPEHSGGTPLDEAQPSAPRRPELESDDARTNDADVRSDERDI